MFAWQDCSKLFTSCSKLVLLQNCSKLVLLQNCSKLVLLQNCSKLVDNKLVLTSWLAELYYYIVRYLNNLEKAYWNKPHHACWNNLLKNWSRRSCYVSKSVRANFVAYRRVDKFAALCDCLWWLGVSTGLSTARVFIRQFTHVKTHKRVICSKWTKSIEIIDRNNRNNRNNIYYFYDEISYNWLFLCI